MRSTPKPYAVLSCHVERILDDDVWRSYRDLVHARPGGFVVASLVRLPDVERGEDEGVWLERARELAEAGPLGHHTHWSGPEHARPGAGTDTGASVLREGTWLKDQHLSPSLFCGGGWYTDASVVSVCAALGYVDCTLRSTRPGYLPAGAAWAQLGAPATVMTASGSMLAVPTTHSLGELVRLAFRPKPTPATVVHGYFHDTDLLDTRRRRALAASLVVLARRRTVCDLDTVAALTRQEAPSIAWEAVARGGASGAPE